MGNRNYQPVAVAIPLKSAGKQGMESYGNGTFTECIIPYKKVQESKSVDVCTGLNFDSEPAYIQLKGERV
ncbi:hypothetical protein [Gimesia chilikensis]|jgi:hypothetical protein|uniref:hypothetical protein n=1 Tax=Gimesia chilikensis TaxID=2605989 RepID=UPI0011A1E67B|nr:hypothetical protein [Gimesia chilikensis]